MIAHARVFHHGVQAATLNGPTAVTIGNFDGVHLGHRALLERVVRAAASSGWHATALTFHPHPTRVVAPHRTPRLLCSLEDRIALLSAAGISQVVVLEFTEALAHLSPEAFASRILAEYLEARLVVVGANFRFGFRQAGDVATLTALGAALGFRAEIVPPVSFRGVTVSSSLIRELVESGRVHAASRLLNRPVELHGEIVKGRGLGSRLTVPTLNLLPHTEVAPSRGVYVTQTLDARSPRQWASVTNVGYRPTFGDASDLSIETFLIDPLDGDPPDTIRLRFLHRLREERKFPTPEALRTQILRDVARAQAYHRRLSRWVRLPTPGGSLAGTR